MFSYLLTIIAFLVLTGTALLYCNILKYNIGEGFVMSVSTLILLIFILGRIPVGLKTCVIFFFVISAVGMAFTVFRMVRGSFDYSMICSLYLPLLFSIMLFSMVLYANDFIRYLDEFHQWALAPKYMLANNRLPIYDDFIGAKKGNVGTSIFHYYFQSFVGYNESLMYVSSTLLTWTGLLLPVSNLNLSHWKRALLYTFIMYFSVATLYNYGNRNLMVDLPVACWMGGLSGWLLNRKLRKENLLLILFCTVTSYLFKGWGGGLLGLFFLFLFLLRKLCMEKKDFLHDNYRKILTFMLVLSSAVVGGITIFVVFLTHVSLTILPLEKINSIIILNWHTPTEFKSILFRFIIGMSGKGLALRASQIKISFVGALVICALIVAAFGLSYNRWREAVINELYLLICASLHCLIVFLVFAFKFQTNIAIRMWSQQRYLSIFIFYILAYILSLLLFTVIRHTGGGKLSAISGMLLLALLVYGIRSDYFVFNSSYRAKDSKNYYDITEQKKEAEKIRSLVGSDKKVYFLNQKGDSMKEYSYNPALYNLSEQISDPQRWPWQFDGDGCVIRFTKYNTRLIEFPSLLTSGQYAYLWIYKTNDFLNRNLPGILQIENSEGKIPGTANSTNSGNTGSGEDNSDETDITGTSSGILDGQLYRIIYNDNGEATGLKFEANLKPYDNRAFAQ